jgi:Putative transposase
MPASLLAALDAQPLDVLVYLRCPSCQWQKILRVPRGRRREPKLEGLLPREPVRHWVFSLGESAQPYLVDQPRLRTRVARACVAAVFAWQRRAAARGGVPEPQRCGAVSAVHRVGATLEANVHVHALVLDGVYAPGPAGVPVFHPLPAPHRRDLRRMLAELRSTIAALLARAVPSPKPVVPRTRTRVVHRVTTSPPVRPVFDPTDALVHRDGELDVRAGPPVAPDDRALRARLCRYVARAPFDPSALEPGTAGRLRYRLHHPFADGTTHVELSPQDLGERLQALAAGEQRPPVAFHGVLAPQAAEEAASSGGQQLALLELPRGPARSREPALALRCPRCDRPLEIVGVEPALSPRAA